MRMWFCDFITYYYCLYIIIADHPSKLGAASSRPKPPMRPSLPCSHWVVWAPQPAPTAPFIGRGTMGRAPRGDGVRAARLLSRAHQRRWSSSTARLGVASVGLLAKWADGHHGLACRRSAGYPHPGYPIHRRSCEARAPSSSSRWQQAAIKTLAV